MLRGGDSRYRCETTAVPLVAMETALGGCRRGRAPGGRPDTLSRRGQQ